MFTSDRMVELLPYYLQNGKNTRKYYAVIARMFDEIIDVLLDILASRNIDTSSLYGLDIIGDIVGENRQGRTDAQYSSALKTSIIAHRSSGDIETLNNYMKSLMGNFFTGLIEGDANLTLRYTFPVVNNPSEFLKKASAAGVTINTQLQTYVGVTGQRIGNLSLNKRLTTI